MNTNTESAANQNTPASIAAARTIVQVLITSGVKHFVLCPGSRSAPLAYALYDAEQADAITLHVRTDERAAAFTALGVGKATGVPAVVVTTSGTAVANLEPAAAEAQMAHVPLLFITADRPAALRGTWANQTHPDQGALLAATAKSTHNIDASTANLATLALTVERSVHSAEGTADLNGPGVVHLNVAFSEPLHGGEPWTPRVPPQADTKHAWGIQDQPDLSGLGLIREHHPQWQAEQPRIAVDTSKPTVVVAGDAAGPAARQFAEQWNLPLFAEPSSGSLPSLNSVLAYRLYLESPAIAQSIAQVVLFGRPTLSRPITKLLHRADVVHVVAPWEWPAPSGRDGAYVRTTMPLVCNAPGTAAWNQIWHDYNLEATAVLRAMAEDSSELTGPVVARVVMEATSSDAALVCGASNSIRDLDLAPGTSFSERRVYANRGLAGIDGTLATARGIALTGPRIVRAMVGDLTFLHDAGALASVTHEAESAPVQIIVINDSGGRIFSRLEYGDGDVAALDRVFTTPVRCDLAHLSAGLNVSHNTVTTREVLEQVVSDPREGISVVEVPIDPRANDCWNRRAAHALG